MQLEMQTVTAPDGTELLVRSYSPESPTPIKTLFWVHGLGEHGGRHEHVAEFLTESGWRLIIPDLRGHGRSSGVRTHVSSFDQYCDDVALIWRHLELCDASTVLLGHSMGGLIAIRTVQESRIQPATLVISSPLLGLKLHVNPFTVLLGRMLIRLVPTARFSNGIDAGNMTHDEAFASLRRSDPLIDKTVTASWYFAMQAALYAAQQQATRISLPVLALQGSLDQTTDPDAMADWWQRIQSTEKTLTVLEDHFHELFFESDWKDTAWQMLEWLDKRNPIRVPGTRDEEGEPMTAS